MSDFAKKQMMKHGWVEGKGLGKNEDGITKPIKSMIKSDYGGLGYKESSDKCWENIYNSAVKNIKIESHEGEVSLNAVNDDWDPEFDLSKLKKKKKKKLGTQLEYDNFQKSSILYNGRLVQDDSATSEEEGETAQDLINVSSFTKDPCMISAKPILRIATQPLCMAKLERIALQDQSLDVTRESYKNLQSLTLPTICRFASLDLMPTWMICNSFKKEEDKDKTNNNIITFQSLQQSVTVKSRSRTKRYRKKINNLADQLSACSIKEIDKESKCDSLNDKNSLRKVKKCSRKKENLNIKCLQLMKKHSIQSCTTKEKNASEQTLGQDKKECEPVQLIQTERDDTPFSKEKSCKPPHKSLVPLKKQPTCLITLKRGASKDGDADKTPSIDIKNNIKNTVYLKKCLKKQKNRRSRRRPRIWEVINNIANKSDTSIDTVAKALTKIHLSEDISTTIKKKPTQTHITPV